MSDISDSGSFNLGLANIASQNYGPAATTEQGLQGAQTQNMQARTQGQQIENTSAALNLQALKIGLSHLYRMPGWQADQSQADQSGVGGAPASAPTSARGSAAPEASSNASGEDDELGSSMSHPEALDTTLRNQFYINPLGTPEEQQNVLESAKISALTKNPAYVQIATQQRDMAVSQRKFQAQQTANTHYSEMAAVADAGDKGNALDVLQAVAPDSAGKIARMHPKEAGESDSEYKDRLNEVAADTAGHFAGHVFQYTGRETETRKDGVVVDKATGFPVAGVRGSGMSPQEYSEAIDKANAPVAIKNSDGSESQIPTWKYAKSQGAPVKSAADYVKWKNDAQQEIAQHKQQVSDHFQAQRTQQQIQQIQQQQQQQQIQQQQQPPAQRAQLPPPGDPKVLRQALSDQDFKLQTPPVVSGRSQTPGDAELQKANVAARQTLLKDSSDLTSTSSQAKSYTDAALAVLNSPDKPPTGLAAPAQVMLSRAMQAIGMTSGDWATRSQELAKYMGNLAVQNFKANFGARPAAKEFDIQMTELNPNNKMTPDAIRDLLQSNARIAKYGIDSGRRAGLYTNQGGDPNRFSEWNERYFPRSDAVNTQTPPTRPGQSSSGGGGSAAATEGATSTSKSGKPIVYTNGHWQYK